MPVASLDELQVQLTAHHYLADRALTTAIFLALKLERPLLLEGEAGVGKTEVARTLARMLGRRLIRLQCYEGLDASTALYEWDYARQLLAIRMQEVQSHPTDRTIFAPEFLLRRPLLQALEPDSAGPPILLIDELDRADEAFEAFLLELLGDWQVSIPELGTIRAEQPPITIITSNRTREIHDALKRRCLFAWVDYPDLAQELAIVQARRPEAPALLTRQVVAFVQALRREDLYKMPGIAETLDWVAALQALDATSLSPELVHDTLGALLKFQDDLALVRGQTLTNLLARLA